MTRARAHLAPSARPQAPGGPSVRARACMRARPSAPPPPVGGEVRAAPRAAVGGPEGGGAVAMARRARPHTNGRPRALPPQLPPTGRSLLPLLPPASAATRARALGPRAPYGSWALGPGPPPSHLCGNGSSQAQGRWPGPAGLPAWAGAGTTKRTLQQEARVSLGNKAATRREGRTGRKKGSPRPGRLSSHATWSTANMGF